MHRATIVVPAFNVSATLADTLMSLKNQTYQDFEVVIVDDGSTDATKQVAEPFLDDRRFWYVHQANRGLSGARNRGITEASGEFIGFCDADDMWHPDKLRRHVKHFDNKPNVGVSYAGSQMIDSHGRKLTIRQSPRLRNVTAAHILKRNPIGNGSSAVIRRAVFDDIAYVHHDAYNAFSYFDETFRQSEDIECWMRIALLTDWAFEGIRGALTYYRVAAEGLSSATERQLDSWENVIAKHRPLHPAFFARHEAAARAYQLRYLARRAISNGDGVAARAYLKRAWASSREPIWAEPIKSSITAAAAQAARFLKIEPPAQKALVKAPVPRLRHRSQPHIHSIIKGDSYE
ncbi:glycosyltransferase family 2 protein [Cognatishimia sp.]|uniref:glycosyltransferase family 2 protein n=1 Tax=Cognatishimia sp. TaxID=2211648 RepID=UPI003513F781